MPLDADNGVWPVALDSVTLGMGAPDTIGVSIYSQCLLPPGAVQKKQ